MLAPSKLNTSDLPDVESLMANIRAEAKFALSSAGCVVPGAPKNTRSAGVSGGAQKSILYSNELNYLNANWHNWNSATEITSHRRFVGYFIVKAKKFFVDLVWNYILKGYFERERQFHMHLVKHLNATARYIDSRNEEIFWQLIEKIDNDISAVVERADHLFQHSVSRVRATQELLQERLSKLESDKEMLVEIAERSHRDIVEVERFARVLENRVADFGQLSGGSILTRSVKQTEATSSDSIPYERSNICSNGDMCANTWVPPSASSEEVTKFFRKYVTFLNGVSGQVLHICVSGETGLASGDLVNLLASEGHKVRDLSGETLSRASRSVFDVLSLLSEFPEKSVGAVCIRNVDIWQIQDWQQFLQLCCVKLQSGGRVIIEGTHTSPLVMLAHSTLSPSSLGGGGVPASSIQGALEHLRFVVHEANANTTYPYQGALKPVSLSGQVPRRWSAIVSSINGNLNKLNDALFGIERYCVLAELPVSE